MIAFRAARCLLLLSILPVSAMTASAQPTLASRLEDAARVQLEGQAESAGLSEPKIEVQLVTTRAAPACASPVAIEPTDTRTLARLRFTVRCPDPNGWRFEYVLRAHLSAVVAVTTMALPAGSLITDDAITMERRDVSAVPDAIGAAQSVVGQATRRQLAAGDILRQGQLAAPIVVKRGEPVLMVAHREQVEVSSSGEALDAGAKGATIRVKSAAGQVVRMRVTGPGTVEPLDIPGVIR